MKQDEACASTHAYAYNTSVSKYHAELTKNKEGVDKTKEERCSLCNGVLAAAYWYAVRVFEKFVRKERK